MKTIQDRKIKRIAAVSFIAAMVLAVLPSSRADAATLTMSDYFPLAVGNTYGSQTQGSAMEPISSIPGTLTFGGQSAYRVRGKNGSEDYYAYTAAGLQLRGAKDSSGTTMTMASGMLIAPSTVQTGVTYSSTGSGLLLGYTIDIFSTFEVVSQEDLIGPSGVIFKNVLKVRWTQRLRSTILGVDITETNEIYFYPGIGIIKDVSLTSPGNQSVYTSAGLVYVSGRRRLDYAASGLNVGGPLGGTFVILEYIDESYAGGGGRVFRRQKADGSYQMLGYYSGTQTIQTIDEYNASGAQTAQFTYFQNGTLEQKNIYQAGVIVETYQYYPSGKLKSHLRPDGSLWTYYEASGNLKTYKVLDGSYLDFIDENFDGQGKGRIAKVVLMNGAEYRIDEYWGGTGVYKSLSVYQNGQFVYTNKFYASGALESTLQADQSINRFYEGSGRLKSLTDPQGNVVEFYDDTFGPSGGGRYAKIVLTSGLEFRFLEYWGNTASYKRLQMIQSGQDVWTQTFYASGALESYTDPAASTAFFEVSQNRKSALVLSTGVLYEHRDEDWQGTKTGRYSKITEQDGSYKLFTSYWGDETPEAGDDTDRVRWVSFYNSQGQLLATFEYDINGNPIGLPLSASVKVESAASVADEDSGSGDAAVSDTQDSQLDVLARMSEERRISSGAILSPSDRPLANKGQ